MPNPDKGIRYSDESVGPKPLTLADLRAMQADSERLARQEQDMRRQQHATMDEDGNIRYEPVVGWKTTNTGCWPMYESDLPALYGMTEDADDAEAQAEA